ncbi:MAG: hypothetical protein HYY17_00760 [Planctomycetes bacterium]|nr:hypothetical protein [Planctomycetota bacterium]
MRHAVVLLILLSACTKRDERPEPREYFAHLTSAAQRRDARRIFQLHSRRSRDTVRGYWDTILHRVKSDPAEAAAYRDLARLPRPVASYETGEELYFAMQEVLFEDPDHRRSFSEARYLGGRADGDRGVITTEQPLRDPRTGKIATLRTDAVLVWEGGEWKLDLDATEHHNRTKR